MHLRIKLAAAMTLAALSLTGCGGGGGAGSSNQTSSNDTATGVAATGAPMGFAVIKLHDANKQEIATTADVNGNYKLTGLSKLLPPFVLAAQSQDGQTTLYSLSASAGTINVNPLTNLAVAKAGSDAAGSGSIQPGSVFSDPGQIKAVIKSDNDVSQEVQKVIAQLPADFQTRLAQNGSAIVDPVKGSYAIGNGLDKTFDKYQLKIDQTGAVSMTDTDTNQVTPVGAIGDFAKFPVVGVYSGTESDPDGNHEVHLILTSSGEFSFVHVESASDMHASGRFTYDAQTNTLTGSGNVNGNYLGSTGLVKSNFSTGSTATYTFNLVYDAASGTLTGSYTFSDGSQSGQLTLTVDNGFTTSTLAQVAGTYKINNGTLTIDQEGNITGTEPEGTLKGKLIYLPDNKNVYRMILTHSGMNNIQQALGLTGAVGDYTMTGLAVLRPNADTGYAQTLYGLLDYSGVSSANEPVQFEYDPHLLYSSTSLVTNPVAPAPGTGVASYAEFGGIAVALDPSDAQGIIDYSTELSDMMICAAANSKAAQLGLHPNYNVQTCFQTFGIVKSTPAEGEVVANDIQGQPDIPFVPNIPGGNCMTTAARNWCQYSAANQAYFAANTDTLGVNIHINTSEVIPISCLPGSFIHPVSATDNTLVCQDDGDTLMWLQSMQTATAVAAQPVSIRR